MKQTKLTKSIKSLAIIFGSILALLCISLSILSIINWNTIPDANKPVIYNSIKFSLFGIIIASICVPILLSVLHFKNFKANIHSITNAIKISIMFAIIVVSTIFMFVESRKYGVHVELWYGHRQFLIALLVLLDCLYLEYFISNTNKYISKINSKMTPEQTLSSFFKLNSFIPESIWIGIGSILGFVMMFFFQKTTHYCFAWTLLLVTYVILNFILMLCLSLKNKKNSKAMLIVFITSIIIGIYLASAYYSMFPVRIIEAIRINYFMCGWAFAFALAFAPTAVLSTKKLI